MPDNKNRIAAVLAIMAMICFMLVFAGLAFGKVPPENKDFFNVSLIALISFVSTAFGYYLGSSVGSAQKNALLAQPLPAIAGVTVLPAPAAAPGSEAGFIHRSLLMPLAGLLCLVLLLFTLYGCAGLATAPASPSDTPVAKAGKALLVTKNAIVTAASATDGLCKAKQLPVATCSQAGKLYEQSKPLYDAAVDSYLIFAQGGDSAQFEQNLLRLSNVLVTLQQLGVVK